jgi:hypothetical protein
MLAMKEKGGAPFVISPSQATNLNNKGFAIFRTVNSFKGQVRRIETLEKLLGWHCDCDIGTKEEQLERIKKFPVVPSLLVESKRGFQCYWIGKDMTQNVDENSPYRLIQKSITDNLLADQNAKDPTRYLRAVGYYHLKDPKDPFLVKEFFRSNNIYSESWMLNALVKKVTPKPFKRIKIYADNIKSGLIKLSGSSAVNSEVFTFKKNGNGTEQIWVNGKSTACWLDKDGMIGSHAKAGPTLLCWLKYYGHDWRRALDILKKEIGDGLY